MFRTLRILRESGPAESAGTPPAAALVANSDAEPEDAKELVSARRKLAEAHDTIKKREQRIAELEDENGQLKRLPKEKETTPAPASKQNKLDEWLY